MKYISTLVFLFIALISLAQSQREKKNFDFDWNFTLEDVSEAKNPNFDDSNWQEVQLPHDWSIKQPVSKENVGEGWMVGSMGYLPGGIGWYRKTFMVPVDFKAKKVVIQFDGVYHQSDVYINGKHLGFHPYGYTTFEYDLTPYLNYGKENTIAVRVDHSDSPSSRWYSGSGIYRHVWLKVTHPVHVATWGTYITTLEISEKEAQVNIATTIEYNGQNPVEVLVQNQIIDRQGKKVAEEKSKLQVGKSKQETLQQSLKLKEPQLWSIDEPTLYAMETTVKVNGKTVDEYKTPFGVREIRFDADKGFFLNGENIKMKGMNLHPDAGSLGTAVPDRSYLRRLQILKEYGVNAIRCSHNPPTTEFLDMCDSLGLVVIDEAFDKWKSGYYEKYFDEWWQRDMDAMILRDRNHPSIVLWSVGNETSEQNWEIGGTERLKMLVEYVKKQEPTRPVTAALRPVIDRPYNKNGFAEAMDIVGYNYQEQWLEEDKAQFPDRIMYISEAYPYFRGRSNTYKDFYPSNPWYDVAENDYVFGQFIWAGVDYLGESSGWPSTGWPTGFFDICMFEKPSAAFHRSVWNEKPMVRIAVADQSLDIDPGKPHWSWPFLASHWNFPQYKGHIVEVHTTTNCDKVELLLNGESLGKRKTSDYSNNTIKWHVPYDAGKIEAKGYNGEKQVAVYSLQTSDEPAQVKFKLDRESITADGLDLAHLEVSLLDENGVLVQTDEREITIEVSGKGKLLGLDTGDIRRDSFSGNSIQSYFGKALVTFQSTREEGNIIVKVKVDGLPEEIISIPTYK
ncbi:glycoside hydrolase family 2 TIM barrel-domain containing protein [Echinicola jeungdonensis]|uniref:Glycoside hydrolase family 2 TIM barrel-domain containing protein n=1 Tax=Echinicola jeungdonensis TaxID=709343 RepID=A0ABV5J8B9_9BACT|nr:glycoside hydrolase family 2 TIM barrel-domain containing protein [Echinicola jeungdonensis]MDN3669497.1 glycoside hydrolase family 2 TIM barrel-domain containing protein [Echinicola jeungdonensis]